MATPQRRSARIRSGGTLSKASTPNPPQALGSLVERDETPDREDRRINTLVSGTPGAFIEVKTPQSKGLQPAHAEMHPEHVHHSTVKVSNAGLKFGFADVNPYQSSPLRPSNQKFDTLSPPARFNPASSPGYEFSFNRDNANLSDEARRIMASVRDEAARIKEKMRQEREEQRRRDEEAEEEAGIGGRRIAKPRSRYSDAHKTEFSKMDSIANHVSVWKNKFQKQKPARPEPTLEESTATPATAKTLKRSHSKLDLEAEKKKSASPSLKRTKSKASMLDVKDKPILVDASSRLENTSPVKRRKTAAVQDVSELRPGSSGTTGSKIPTMAKSSLPTAISTPTKSSLARSKSIQNLSPSKLPTSTTPTSTLHRSKSLKSIAKPSNLRTASGRLASAMANKINSVRSILHRPQPKYSDDPAKIASGTHLPMPKPTPSHHEGTPSLPGTPRPHHTLPRATPKKVEFAPDTKAASEKTLSPSPMKATVAYPQIARSIERSVSASPTKSTTSESADVPTPKAAYPTPAKPTSAIRHSVSSLAKPLFSNPPTSGDFTFTHEKRIRFGTTISASSSREPSTTAAPPSIRLVRGSIPASIRPSPASQHMILGVPHGINNKKRARDHDHDVDSSDIENLDPKRRLEADDEAAEQGSPRKRVKTSAAPAKSPVKMTPATKRRQTGTAGSAVKAASASAAKKIPGLSLARLNFLASPKVRR